MPAWNSCRHRKPFAALYEVNPSQQALKQLLGPRLCSACLLFLATHATAGPAFRLLIYPATAVMTNVPGPQSPLYLGGAEIKQIMLGLIIRQYRDGGLILSFNRHGAVSGSLTNAQMVPIEVIIVYFRS